MYPWRIASAELLASISTLLGCGMGFGTVILPKGRLVLDLGPGV